MGQTHNARTKTHTHTHIHTPALLILQFVCVCVCVCVCQAHHPIESDHVFPIVVVERHMTFHHLTQRVDVLPGSPTILFCKCAVMQRPNNTDLTNEPPHQLDQAWRRKGRQKKFRVNNQPLNIQAESSII